MKRNFLGFTLAEVLIALVIVGVVAALTVPSVVVNYQKKQAIVKVKKAYSMLHEAFNMAQVKYGDKTTWEWDQTTYQSNCSNNPWAKKYLFPFLKGTENYKYKNYFTIQGFSGTGYGGKSAKNSYSFLTTDGVGIDVCGGGTFWYNTWAFIVFDINANKKPNVYGKDIFVTYYTKDSKKGLVSARWVSWFTPFKSIDEATQNCISGGMYTSACLDAIMLNNWEFPDNYPW